MRSVGTGHAALNAELPGAGWPLGALIELLQTQPDAAGFSLLLPAVVARVRGEGGAVVLVNPPHEPFLPALAAAGLAAPSILLVRAETPAAQLWSAEQALRCGDVAAVLAWLPCARSAQLRRLHLAAAQRLDSLLFALRPVQAADAASPALLRLRVSAQAAGPGQSAPTLRVHILKRRGPPQHAPVSVPAHGEPLRALLAATARTPEGAAAPTGGTVLPFDPRLNGADPGDRHALDRLAVAA